MAVSLIDGFYDDVAPITDQDRAALAALPSVDRPWRDELELGGTEAGDAPLAGRVLLPALNVRGLAAGHVGAEATNAIPAEARASIDFRLVPRQTPAGVRERVEAHLTKYGWFVTSDSVTAETRRSHPRVMRLTWDEGLSGVPRVPLDAPIARFAARHGRRMALARLCSPSRCRAAACRSPHWPPRRGRRW